MINKSKSLFLLDRQERLRLMKFLIKPIGFKPFISTSTKNLKPLCFPRVWGNDLIKICKKYEIFIIFKKNKKAVIGGSYNNATKLITIEADRNGWISTEDLIIVFSHELSHYIQYIFYNMYSNKRIISCFDDYLIFEREADNLSYYIYQMYFKHKEKINSNTFRSYYSKYVVDNLKESYKKKF